MNFLWIPEVKVQKRIEQLNIQNKIQLQYKTTSPTIDLLRETEKVKKTKEIYENGLKSKGKGLNANADRLIVNSKMPTRICKPKPRQCNDKEQRFISDLIACENEHLEKLHDTSRILKSIIDSMPNYISKMVRDHHIGLSGFLADIIELHRSKILPKFESNKSFPDILRFMLHLIENNELYLYVSHAILYNSILQWLENYKIVLDAIYSKHGSYLNKLEIDDIVGHYKDWIDDVCEELTKDVLKNADDIALCMDVEHKFDRLMEAIADGKKISYIKEVSKNNIEAIDKMYQIIAKKELICHPMIFLVPRHDCFYGYRNPIDVLSLGHFVRIWSEMLFSETSNCHYYTNLFIFERCIIYTVVVNANHFVYNGHFWMKDCEFETVTRNNKQVTLAVLSSGDRKLMLDNPEFVNAVMRLHALHKNDNVDREIDIPFKMHLKILSKIEIRKIALVTPARLN